MPLKSAAILLLLTCTIAAQTPPVGDRFYEAIRADQ
jgi:hypothetical protein